MDLGSSICLPKTPKCNECPLGRWCQGKDTPQLYTQQVKKESIAMELFFGICIQNGMVALVPSTNGMYKNMLVFPDVDPIEEHFIGSYKHAYTKYRLTVKLYKMEHPPKNATWIALGELEKAHIPSLVKKAIKFLPKVHPSSS
jgi:adenine-specific DNA glycosylase